MADFYLALDSVVLLLKREEANDSHEYDNCRKTDDGKQYIVML
jgi:hypothetical protein